MNKTLKFLVVLSFVAVWTVANITHAQTTWHKTPITDGAKIFDHIIAISIPAEATYNGVKMRAQVFIEEHDQSGKAGVPKLHIYVENIDDIVPSKELLKFVGPDLPLSVINGGTFDLSVNIKGAKEQLLSYTDYNYESSFEKGFNTSGYFALDYSKSNRAKWKELVTKMSDGFTDADIDIGGKVLSHKLHVHFTGAGLGSQLKDLMQFCEK